MDIVAKSDDGLAISGLTDREIAAARTGVGKVGDQPPGLAVHGDDYVGSQFGSAIDRLRH